MKCEKCNDREANFFYTATINGETTQTRLCAECAREEGFALDFGRSPAGMAGGFFPSPFSMLDGFFGPGVMTPVLVMPRFAAPHPYIPRVACTQTETQAEASAAKIPEDAGEEVRARRELQALKHQLDAAVKAEDFEKAIELRDRIRALDTFS